MIYRNQRYPVNALEPGDRVNARVERGQRGEMYATLIQVEQSVSEDGGGRVDEGRIERFEGEVTSVDTQRGRFEMRAYRTSYVVSLPYNPSGSVIDRFRRLRRGDTVRIEGELIGNGRIELYRFR